MANLWRTYLLQYTQEFQIPLDAGGRTPLNSCADRTTSREQRLPATPRLRTPTLHDCTIFAQPALARMYIGFDMSKSNDVEFRRNVNCRSRIIEWWSASRTQPFVSELGGADVLSKASSLLDARPFGCHVNEEILMNPRERPADTKLAGCRGLHYPPQ